MRIKNLTEAKTGKNNLHPKLQKEMKNNYKKWDKETDELNADSDIIVDKEKSKKNNTFTNPTHNSPKSFGGNGIERKDFPFYVTFYSKDNYGSTLANKSKGFKTREEAENYLNNNKTSSFDVVIETRKNYLSKENLDEGVKMKEENRPEDYNLDDDWDGGPWADDEIKENCNKKKLTEKRMGADDMYDNERDGASNINSIINDLSEILNAYKIVRKKPELKGKFVKLLQQNLTSAYGTLKDNYSGNVDINPDETVKQNNDRLDSSRARMKKDVSNLKPMNSKGKRNSIYNYDESLNRPKRRRLTEGLYDEVRTGIQDVARMLDMISEDCRRDVSEIGYGDDMTEVLNYLDSKLAEASGMVQELIEKNQM